MSLAPSTAYDDEDDDLEASLQRREDEGLRHLEEQLKNLPFEDPPKADARADLPVHGAAGTVPACGKVVSDGVLDRSLPQDFRV